MAITAGSDILASDFKTTSAGAGDSGKVPVLNASGKIDVSFMFNHFGDGSDGDVTISSPTTLTRDMYYQNLTVTSTLTTDGYRIFVNGTLSGAGTIIWGTPNAGGTPTTGAGTGGAQSGNGPLKNTAGTSGGVGSTSALISNGNPATAGADGRIGNNGAKGGNTGGGAATGNGGTNISKIKPNIEAWSALSFQDWGNILRTIPGSSGGSSAGCGASGGAGYSFGGGGGAGASGGIVWIAVNIWAGTFTISAPGANGGNGGATTAGYSNTGGAGGGAGGNGGISFIIYGSKTWTGSYVFTPGTGGTGAAGYSGGGTGGTGANGGAGVSYEIQYSNLL